MHMLHCLAFYAAYYRFQFTAEHIPVVLNVAADALSHDNISLFHSLVPQSQPVALPAAVVDLIVNSRPDWGSQAWTRSFTNSLIREFPPPPEPSTSQDGVNTRNFCITFNIAPLPLMEDSHLHLLLISPTRSVHQLYVHTYVPLDSTRYEQAYRIPPCPLPPSSPMLSRGFRGFCQAAYAHCASL